MREKSIYTTKREQTRCNVTTDFIDLFVPMHIIVLRRIWPYLEEDKASADGNALKHVTGDVLPLSYIKRTSSI